MNREIRPPACPICHHDMDIYEFLKMAASVFSAVGTREKCPYCQTTFYLESEEAEDEVVVLNEFTGKRRPMMMKVCACGCGMRFRTRKPNQKYLDNRHRQHAYDVRRK